MNMKLILRADVDNLGRLGDIVSVKPGYGRNYLIPQGLAMQASKANLKQFELERNRLQKAMDEIRAQSQSLADKINAVVLTIPVRVGEGGKLYGSVTSANLSEQLAEQGVELDRKKIDLDEPIRSLGEYAVPVKLLQDVTAEIKVQVVRHDTGTFEEEGAEQAAEAAEDVAEAVAEAPATEETAEAAESGQSEPAEDTEQEG